MEVPTAARTLAVLDLLARSAEPLPAAHLARTLNIPRASLYRLLDTMRRHGYVTPVSDSNRWALGLAAHELAWGYERQTPLQRAARPLISRLVDATGHTAHFTVLHGRNVIYVVEERAPGRPLLVSDVGVRLPAELTASGVAMLAAMTSAQVSALYPNASALVQRDGRGPGTVTELRRVLAEARRRGFAVEDETVTPGLGSVALPVLDSAGHPIAAVAVTYPRAETDDRQRAELVAAVRRTVATLHARLGVTG